MIPLHAPMKKLFLILIKDKVVSEKRLSKYNYMMRFKLKERFEGLNENGLTFDEVIKKDVKDHIDTFLYYMNRVCSKDWDLDGMDMANLGNARFVLSCYYKQYLNEYVPGALSDILKREIENKITLKQLSLN